MLISPIMFVFEQVSALDGLQVRNQGQTKTTIFPGESIKLYAQGKDDTALNSAWLATNETGTWKEYTGYQDWLYRKEIIIDHTLVADDLMNFPVLIKNISVDFAQHAQDDGDDFIFVDVDTGVQYAHEIEYYDNETGELFVWVNIPALSATENTQFYVYYGNPTCDNQENAELVWQNGFLMVHHMDGASYDALDDSTAHQWDVISDKGDPTYNRGGKIRKCVEFDGNRDSLQIGEFRLAEDSSYTASAWLYYTYYESSRLWAFSGDLDWSIGMGTGDGTFRNVLHAAGGTAYSYGTTPVDGRNPEWFYVSTRADAIFDRLDLLVNGVVEANDTIQGMIYPELGGFVIGAYGDDGEYSAWWKGKIDEVRVANVVRSDAWVETEYTNMVSPEVFATVGNEQSVVRGGPYGSPMMMQGTAAWQWSNFTWCNPGVPVGTVVGWRIYYNDTEGNTVSTPVMSFSIIDANSPPETPGRPSGPSTGYIGGEYSFSVASVVDPDGDYISFLVDWGDGNQTGWTEYVPSGSGFDLAYTWPTEGSYDVKAKVKDEHGAETTWSPVRTISITEAPLPQLHLDAPSSVDEDESFIVTVTYEDTPIKDAQVEFRDEMKLSDSDGIALFTAPRVFANTTVSITASKTGYQSATRSITILDQFQQPGQGKGWMYGRVTDTSNKNLEGVRVSVQITEVTTQTALTDQQGYNMLIPVGTYTVSASKQGYITSTVTDITISKDAAIGVNFELEEISEYQPPATVDEDRDVIEAVINAGITSDKIGGEINVEQPDQDYNITLYKEELSVGNVSIQMETVSFTVEAEDLGGTIIALRIFGKTNLSDVIVEYDGAAIDRVGFVDIFNVETNETQAKYTRLITDGDEGNLVYCLIYIPHFSDHDITIYTQVVETVLDLLAVAVYLIIIAIFGIISGVPLVRLWRKIE